MSKEILRLEALAVGYGQHTVVENVSFAVNAGEFVAMIAPNGAGKSTLLKTIAGFMRPQAGDIWLAGKRQEGLSRNDMARLIAMVAVDDSLYSFTVEQVVEMGRFPHIARLGSPTRHDRQIVDESITMLGLGAKRQQYVQNLSMGEKQKVTLARVLAQEPRLLLLDEATSHLDIANQYLVMQHMKQLANANGLAVIAVIHDVNLALAYADRMILLNKGKMLADGHPSKVITVGNLKQLYGLNFCIKKEEESMFIRPLPEIVSY